MNHLNTENILELRAQRQQQKQVDAMVNSVQNASEARDRSEANYRVARAFDRSADRLQAMPHMQAVSEARRAEYTARGDEFAIEATKHDMEVDQAAQRLGEHVVRHEAVPEYSPKEAVSVIDLR